MEETNAIQHGVKTETTDLDTTILLTHFIENHAASFMGILRGYVRKAELVSDRDEDVQDATLELLHEVYIEAVKTSAHFDPTRSPQAWLLGIANRLVMRKKVQMAELRQHETLLSGLQRENQEDSPDEESLDKIIALTSVGPEQEVESNEQFENLLSLVSENDQYILRLSIEQDLDGEALAQVLGCRYQTALVRLFRARKRLRAAIERRQRGEING